MEWEKLAGTDRWQAVCKYTGTRYQVYHTTTSQHGPYMLSVYLKDKPGKDVSQVFNIGDEAEAKELAELNAKVMSSFYEKLPTAE